MYEPLQRLDTRHVSIWSSPGRGLWVASDGHFYRGMIERAGTQYICTDGQGRSLGTFASLDEAKRSIDCAELEIREVAMGA